MTHSKLRYDDIDLVVCSEKNCREFADDKLSKYWDAQDEKYDFSELELVPGDRLC